LSPSTGRRPDGAADAAAGEMPDALIGPVNGVTLFTAPKNGLNPVKNGLALKKNGLTLLAPVKPKPGTNPFTLELNPKPGTKLKSGRKKVPGFRPPPDGFAGLSGSPPRPKVGSSVVAGLTPAPSGFAGLNTPLTGGVGIPWPGMPFVGWVKPTSGDVACCARRMLDPEGTAAVPGVPKKIVCPENGKNAPRGNPWLNGLADGAIPPPKPPPMGARPGLVVVCARA